MHIDMNSCFASIEQQANPLLRGKPVAVAAYTTPSGCIIAPSIEAKKLGIKVGMRVKDGKKFCPELIILPTDPWKYRHVHLKLRRLLSEYTDKVIPKSIDEFVLDLQGYPAFTKGMKAVALEIKKRIKKEVGDWLRVSVGIGPNRFLAKTAAGLRKPDGLEEINKNNFLRVYSGLKLTDLCGIKTRNAERLNRTGIFSVLDFYKAGLWQLKAAFSSICGYYWYLRLRGWEIDDFDSTRQSFGNSYALPKPLITPTQLSPILQKLVEKTGFRLRAAGFQTQGVHLGIVYRDWTFWHHGQTLKKPIFTPAEIYHQAYQILLSCPWQKPVRELSVSCFNLCQSNFFQPDLFGGEERKANLTKALDKINERWGNFVIAPARILLAAEAVPDRIAFGGVNELEDCSLKRYNILWARLKKE